MNVDAESFLKNLIDQKTHPQALIFVGADAAGMKKSAYSYVHEVFSRLGSSDAQCEKIQRHAHPDLKVYQPASKTGFYSIEQIREICELSYLYPNEAAKQFFVLEHADRMQDAAANALLKTLEEPVKDSAFILLAQSLDDILPTIVSRAICVFFDTKLQDDDHSPLKHQLQEILNLWPQIQYNDVYLGCNAIQKLLEQEENSSDIENAPLTFLDKEVFKLFIQIEKWYQEKKFFQKADIIDARLFEKSLKEAKSALKRFIKPAVVLEHLLLNFVS